ncbi:hypothetical protein [Streptococcus chenjunshii]|nr:hypothetical protein [Streptococcus chenjunshii]
MTERYYLKILSGPARVNFIYVTWVNCFFFLLLYGLVRGAFGFIPLTYLVVAFGLIHSVLWAVMGFFRKLLYRFQLLVLAASAVQFLLFIFCIDALGLFLFCGGYYDGSDGLEGLLLQGLPEQLYAAAMLVVFCAATAIYALIYRRAHLRQAGPPVTDLEQTLKERFNYNESWLWIFGLAILAPALLTGRILLVFSLVISLLITSVFPALIVDCSYAIYCLRKNPSEREVYVQSPESLWRVLLTALRKPGNRLFTEIGLFLTLAFAQGALTGFASTDPAPWMRVLGFVFLVDWIGMAIWQVFKLIRKVFGLFKRSK